MESGALAVSREILIRMSLADALNVVGELTTTLFGKSDIVENSPSYFDCPGQAR